MRVLIGVALCGFTLTACSEQEVLRYQDRPAETALECEAAYQAARQRGNNQYMNTSSGASFLGASLGRGLAKGIVESSYKQCLARVADSGGEPTQTNAAETRAASARAQIEAELRATPLDSRPATCPANAPVVYGGTQYCVRR
jgi:hypothetical protein